KFQDVKLKGSPASEIDQLASRLEVKFPQAYRDFLARIGKGAGEFMLSDHWMFMFDDVPEIAHDDDYSELCDLPDDYFVFAERNGCAWVFFVADGKSDDPPVYLFTDGDERDYKQIGRSLWEFVESLVIDYEIWFAT
ncbi:MAG: SMI1/KNR4 family protein, partial [Planctomycetales bacterium]